MKNEQEEPRLSVCVQEKLEGTALSELKDHESIPKVLEKIGSVMSKIHQVRTHGFGWTSPESRGMFSSWEKYLAKANSKKERLLDIGSKQNLDTSIISKALELDGEVSGVIDFENCIGGDPVYDLARWELLHGEKYPVELIKRGYTDIELIEDNYESRLNLYTVHSGLSVIDYLDSTQEYEKLRHVFNRISYIVS